MIFFVCLLVLIDELHKKRGYSSSFILKYTLYENIHSLEILKNILTSIKTNHPTW